MSGNRKRLYYRLTPVYEPEPGQPPQVLSAAVVTCMATGRILASGGGGSLALAPEIVDALDGSKDPDEPRMILGTKELAAIRYGLRLGLMHYFKHTRMRDESDLDRLCREALERAVLIASGTQK